MAHCSPGLAEAREEEPPISSDTSSLSPSSGQRWTPGWPQAVSPTADGGTALDKSPRASLDGHLSSKGKSVDGEHPPNTPSVP